MEVRRLRLWLGLVLAGLWTSVGSAQAQGLFFSRKGEQWQQRLRAAAQVPLDQLPAQVREDVRLALEKPTLFTTGPGESFLCRPELYYWLLDHPDKAVSAWRRLGAVCLDITDRGGGRFGWADEQGNNLYWDTVYRSGSLRIWYAQGVVRPGPLLPLVPVRAVVILRHGKTREEAGAAVMYHQADIFVHTDSRTAALATRLMGPSAPRMAEQGVAQMQMFFSALAWYCQRYPERADSLLAGSQWPRPAAAPAVPAGQVPTAAAHPEKS
jgi:hypothetical protein